MPQAEPNQPAQTVPGGDGLLDRCPRCTYRLDGLPERRRCPECGFEFDRRWRVFGGRLMRFLPRGKRSSLAPALFVVMVSSTMLMASVSVMIWSIMPIGIIAVTFGVVLLVVARRPTAFIAVGPDGVLVHQGEKKRSQYEWPRIGKAEHAWLRKELVIEIDGKPLRLPVQRFFGLSPFHADDCARAINRMRP